MMLLRIDALSRHYLENPRNQDLCENPFLKTAEYVQKVKTHSTKYKEQQT